MCVSGKEFHAKMFTNRRIFTFISVGMYCKHIILIIKY